MKNICKQHGVLVTLLLAGVLTRLLAAWRFRHMVNLDAGVVALMAKHIAEGRELPVFFYGQAHMGSLEALLSGFFCWIFGLSGFAVNLGTAVVAMGLLPCVYLWAKAAAGRRAGLIALALCVIGPGGFFHYNGSPRGGYAAALTFGAFVLMYATRMVIKWKEHATQSGRDFFILGLAAGVAWWSSQLTTASILTAALLLLAGIGLSVFTVRIFAGLAGFFLGSLPLWWWNITHDWQTFQFAGSFGRTRFSEALGWLYTDRFLSLYTYPNWPEAVRVLFIIQVLSLVLAAMFFFVNAILQQDKPLFWGLCSVGLFAMVFSGFYASSHLAVLSTPRYVLPLVGPLAVLCGIVIVKARRYVPAAVAMIPFVVLAGLQVPTLLDTSLTKSHERKYDDILEFGEEAKAQGLDMMYALNHFRSWNFILREQVKVVDLMHEVYPPHAQQAERSSELNVMDNYGLIRNGLQRAGGEAERVKIGKWRVWRDFSPPPLAEKTLPPSGIHSIRDDRGRDYTRALMSGTGDQMFQQATGERPGTLTVEFTSPQRVSGIRYWPVSELELPKEMHLEGRIPEGDWVALASDAGNDQYFWSGPRLFFGSHYFRRDFRFAERELGAVRLSFKSRSEHLPVSIHHLDVLVGEAPPVEWTEAMTNLLDILREEDITSVLADRWESNQIVHRTDGRIFAALAPSIFPDHAPLSKLKLDIPASGAVLVLETHAEQVRRTFKERECILREIPCFPWILFVSEEARSLPGLYWNGLSVFKIDAAYGLHLWESGHRERAREYHPYLVRPDLPTSDQTFQFQHGIALRDFQLSRTEVKPGEVIRMDYVWELPPEVDPSTYAVFVHFYQEHNVWGDDRVFLSDIPAVYLEVRPDHGLFPVGRTVTIPPGTEPGSYHIRFGLYDRRSLKRLRVSGSAAPTRKNAVEWPVSLTVTSP
ncbi:MAG: hypothetical protein PF795_12000 [Kiritimatiellae bacterium]|jgi:hypothetical protein|nr:hypothetical protein [Kiritimatiellia bacterium]